jgi:hypothetical protein
MLAIWRKDFQSAYWLLKNTEIDIMCVDRVGRGVLWYFQDCECWQEAYDLFAFLIEAGADLDARHVNGADLLSYISDPIAREMIIKAQMKKRLTVLSPRPIKSAL